MESGIQIMLDTLYCNIENGVAPFLVRGLGRRFDSDLLRGSSVNFDVVGFSDMRRLNFARLSVGHLRDRS